MQLTPAAAAQTQKPARTAVSARWIASDES
jgi:hypothetical protein